MKSGERTLLLIFGISCLLIIGILIIILWPYRELVGSLVVGLIALTVVVALVLWVIRTLTDAAVKLHEQKLRQERLRPNDHGYYEIPLDGAKISKFSLSNTQDQERQEPYSHEYAPPLSYRGRWD